MSYPTIDSITVPYTILTDGSGQGSIGQNGAQDTIVFRLMDPLDLETFIEDISGSGLSGIPMQHPIFLGLYASTASWSLIPASTSPGAACSGADYLNAYQGAKVTVTFATPVQDYSGADQYTTRLKYSANMVTLPEASYKFASGLTVPQGVGRLVPQIEFSLSKNQGNTTIDVPTITSLCGRINNATYLNCAPGTLLFGGASTDVTFKMMGSPTYQSEYAFIFRPVPWNQFLRPDGSAWEEVKDPSGDPVYTPGDFTLLKL